MNDSRATTLEEKYESKVVKTGNRACWLWKGAVNSSGYGNIGHKGKTLSAPRVSYELHVGPIPKRVIGCDFRGTCVRHRCVSRACTNPRHLRLGSHRDNMRDKVDQGRTHHPIGVKNVKAKLTDSAVQTIRDMRRSGIPLKVVAKLFGLAVTYTCTVARGKFWKHVKSVKGKA